MSGPPEFVLGPEVDAEALIIRDEDLCRKMRAAGARGDMAEMFRLYREAYPEDLGDGTPSD